LYLGTLAVLVSTTTLVDARAAPAVGFRRLQPGLEYAAIPVTPLLKDKLVVRVKDDKLHVVRISPQRARLRVLVASALDRNPRTAAQWAKRHKLAAAINLGMYLNDHLTHVGFLRSGGHTNSARWVSSYQSLLVLGPRRAGLPVVQVVDREALKMKTARLLGSYYTVVQNLRLIKHTRSKPRGVWSPQPKRWSEAAVAFDRRGRLLLLFVRAPLSMHQLNELLLRLPLGIVRAMHMEGGPEASLSIHAGGVNLDLCGSFETGFVPDDTNSEQWPIPNVLGVARR
jgi:hypothetical protein